MTNHHLLGYYVAAIILSVITALVTIYHHQIVAKLTPAAQWVKKSVLSCISSSTLLLPHSDHHFLLRQASRRVVDSDSPPLHLIFSSGASHPSSPGSAIRQSLCPTALWSRNHCYSLWRRLGSLDWICHCCSRLVSWRIGQLLVRHPSSVKRKLTQDHPTVPA